ncbi:MAG: polymer-forming cytoskeletal protein [Burkholderiaceae bacterium]|nr:polymer-forming cytoskeletal protein [Burkholderiaceae bacterium]
MFSRKKHPPIRSLISEGTVIRGELQFSEGLRIDGEVRGDVIDLGSERSILVISEKAQVIGKVKAGHVIVNGTIKGPVIAEELLELQPKARIVGDVTYETIEMHPGATIQGMLHPLKAEEKPALKLATAGAA